MAFCKNCGEQLTDGVKFCGNCGAKVEQVTQTGSQRKTTFDGEIHKCPNCGEILKAFETVCPSCKFELRGIGANNSVKDLTDKLERTREQKQKITIIQNYPIPTTTEDIYELFLLAYSNFDTNLYVAKLNCEDISDAWYSLVKRCYEKSIVCIANQKILGDIQEKYNKLNNNINTGIAKQNRKKTFQKNKGWIIVACILAIVILVVAVVIPTLDSMSITINKNSEEMKGMDYEELEAYLRSQGFNNIIVEFTGLGWFAPGEVTKVSVGGTTSFRAADTFLPNTLIVITAHPKNNKE